MDKPTKALHHVANGDDINEVGNVMNLSRSSIEKHLATIRKRLNAKTLAHAVHIATRSGLIVVMFYMTTFAPSVDFERRRLRLKRREQYSFLLQVGIYD